MRSLSNVRWPRRSTVVAAVVFVAVGILYLVVRPDPEPVRRDEPIPVFVVPTTIAPNSETPVITIDSATTTVVTITSNPLPSDPTTDTPNAPPDGGSVAPTSSSGAPASTDPVSLSTVGIGTSAP